MKKKIKKLITLAMAFTMIVTSNIIPAYADTYSGYTNDIEVTPTGNIEVVTTKDWYRPGEEVSVVYTHQPQTNNATGEPVNEDLEYTWVVTDSDGISTTVSEYSSYNSLNITNNCVIDLTVTNQFSKSANFNISVTCFDTFAPSINTINPDENQDNKINIDASDAESGLNDDAYSIDGVNWQSSNSFELVNGQTYEISVRDKVGNIATINYATSYENELGTFEIYHECDPATKVLTATDNTYYMYNGSNFEGNVSTTETDCNKGVVSEYHKHTGDSETNSGCYSVANYHVHNVTDNNTTSTTPEVYDELSNVQGGCYTVPMYHMHSTANTDSYSDQQNRGAEKNKPSMGCYTIPNYHVHSTTSKNETSLTSGEGSTTSDTQGGCYTVPNYHKHSISDDDETSLSAGQGYIDHSSNSAGCYTKPIYHEHSLETTTKESELTNQGASTSGLYGGCYTKAVYKTHTHSNVCYEYYNLNYFFVNSTITTCSTCDKKAYKGSYTVDSPIASENNSFERTICEDGHISGPVNDGEFDDSEHKRLVCTKAVGQQESVVDYYETNCDLDENLTTPRWYVLNCGKYEPKVEYYTTSCNHKNTDVMFHTPGCGNDETTVRKYALSCTKQNTDIDFYSIGCDKDETSVYNTYYTNNCSIGDHGHIATYTMTKKSVYNPTTKKNEIKLILEKIWSIPMFTEGTVTWSDGSTGNELTINSSGSYSAVVTYNDGVKNGSFKTDGTDSNVDITDTGDNDDDTDDDTDPNNPGPANPVGPNSPINVHKTIITRHYKQNVDGMSYSVDSTNRKNVNVGNSYTPDVRTYEGFTSPSTQTVSVTSDDASIIYVDYYYTRNKYDYTFNFYRENVNDSNGNILDRTQTGTAYYGATVYSMVYQKVGHTAPERQSITIGVGSNTKDLLFTANNYDLTIEKYTRDINSDNYTLFDTTVLSYKYGKVVDINPTAISGFATPSSVTHTISTDNNYIRLDYDRNKYNITINCNYINANDEVQTFKTETKLMDYQDVIEPEELEGYMTPSNSYTVPAMDKTFNFYYKQIADYTVEYYIQDLDKPLEYTLYATDSGSGIVGTLMQINLVVIKGYDAPTQKVITIDKNSENNVVKYYYDRHVYEITVIDVDENNNAIGGHYTVKARFGKTIDAANAPGARSYTNYTLVNTDTLTVEEDTAIYRHFKSKPAPKDDSGNDLKDDTSDIKKKDTDPTSNPTNTPKKDDDTIKTPNKDNDNWKNNDNNDNNNKPSIDPKDLVKVTEKADVDPFDLFNDNALDTKNILWSYENMDEALDGLGDLDTDIDPGIDDGQIGDDIFSRIGDFSSNVVYIMREKPVMFFNIILVLLAIIVAFAMFCYKKMKKEKS